MTNQCPNCGGTLVGDGVSSVIHCEYVDVLGEGYAPDEGPVYCDFGQEVSDA